MFVLVLIIRIIKRLKDGNEKLKARKFQCNNSAAALGLAAKNKEYHYYTGFDDLGVMERKRQLVAIDEVVQKVGLSFFRWQVA